MEKSCNDILFIRYLHMEGLYFGHIFESSACSCEFKNEDEIHFFLACPLYYRPRVTLLNALAHIAPLTARTLLYGNDTYEIEENKIIIIETLRFIKEYKRFD